jgi:serralysin
MAAARTAAAADLREETMAGGTANTPSLNVNIDALLGNFKWNNPNLTYNFPVDAGYYDAATYFTAGSIPSSPTHDFTTKAPPPASLQSAITHVITTQLMEVAPLNYTLVAPGAAADSSFARADLFDDPELAAPPGGVGFYPGAVQRGGDAWFNVNQNRFNDVDVGDSAYWVVLHELGHTIGLKHGHANDRPGPTDDILPDEVNSMEFSVMTYHRYVGDEAPFNDTEEGSFAQSLMMLDIAAIQYMYGANFNSHAGNTVYTFSATTGEMFIDGVGQGTPELNRIFRTVWDGNGIDTYDLSNYTTDLQIDLAPGGWSVFDEDQLALLSISNDIHARGNVFNALQFNGDARSLIENAIGGSGNDTINGNAANNFLSGNGGNDTLSGLDGNDTLEGGVGADALNGGDGFDFASYQNAGAGVGAALIFTGLFDAGEAVGDRFTSIEGLIGSKFDDTLIGNIGGNILKGMAGNDDLYGLWGDDVLIGGAGRDNLDGGVGFDFASYEGGAVGVFASLATPARNTGEAAGDTYNSIEGLIGTSLNDQLGGNFGDNELRGGAGNDQLAGLGGDDRLDGGTGDDTMAGGFGDDIFVFGEGYGHDTITDWQDSILSFFFDNDHIALQGLSMRDLSITYDRQGATIHIIGTDDELRVVGAHQGSLTAEDFLFI